MTTQTEPGLPDLVDARDYLKSWGCLANPNVRMILEQAEADRAKRLAGPVLTEEQIRLIAINMPNDELEAVIPFARAIESAVLAKLKEPK